MKFKVYGASDDLIEIEGDKSEEFSAPYGDPCFLAVICGNDATILRINYGSEGTWEIRTILAGDSLERVEGLVCTDDTEYSDVAYFNTAFDGKVVFLLATQVVTL